MKISWMNVVGALLVIFFGYMYLFGNLDGFGKMFLTYPILVSLLCAIFGSRQRFQSLILKGILIMYAIVGVIIFIVTTFGPFNPAPESISNIAGAGAVFVITVGFFGSLFGVAVWIYNEVKDFRAKKV